MPKTRMQLAEMAEQEAIARRNKPVDADDIERVCKRLAELSNRHGMRDLGRDITYRFKSLNDCLAVRAVLDGRWTLNAAHTTATQAVYDVAGMTVTLFCPELKHCRDHVARGIGTLRPDRDFTILLDD